MKVLCLAVILSLAASYVAGKQTSSYSYTLAGGAGRSRFTLFTGSLDRKPKPTKAENTLSSPIKSENLGKVVPSSGRLKYKLKNVNSDIPKPNLYRNDLKSRGSQAPSLGGKPNVFQTSAAKEIEQVVTSGVPRGNSVADSGSPRDKTVKPSAPHSGTPNTQGSDQALRLPGTLNGVSHSHLSQLVAEKLSKFGSGATKSHTLSTAGRGQVTSSVHIHVAPDRQAPPPIVIKSVKPPPHKHYNVILVKTPTAQPPKILLPQVRNENSEKSLIYLLHEAPKQPTPPKLVVTPNVVSQPEVFLIKYDANNSPGYPNQPSHTNNKGEDAVKQGRTSY